MTRSFRFFADPSRYFLTVGLALTLFLTPAVWGADSKEGLERAVSSQMNEIVSKDVDAFFRKLHINPPSKIAVSTRVDIDTSGASPRITKVGLDVKVVTDQPPQIIRETRHRLMRLLREQGYRMDASEGVPDDTRPYAALTIEAVTPPPTKDDTAQTLVYVGFAGLIIALLTSLGTLVYILFLPLLRWRRATKQKRKTSMASGRMEPEVRDLPPIPHYLGEVNLKSGPKAYQDTALPPIPVSYSDEPTSDKAAIRSSGIEVGGWSTLTQAD